MISLSGSSTGGCDSKSIVKGTGKVVPVLNELSTTPWRHMGVCITDPPFLTSAQYGGEWSASRPDLFTAGEEPSVPNGYGGPQSHDLNAVKRKMSFLPKIEPRPSSPSIY
jgi:hypothetical protein